MGRVRYVYQREWLKSMVNALYGKYTVRPMDPLGKGRDLLSFSGSRELELAQGIFPPIVEKSPNELCPCLKCHSRFLSSPNRLRCFRNPASKNKRTVWMYPKPRKIMGINLPTSLNWCSRRQFWTNHQQYLNPSSWRAWSKVKNPSPWPKPPKYYQLLMIYHSSCHLYSEIASWLVSLWINLICQLVPWFVMYLVPDLLVPVEVGTSAICNLERSGDFWVARSHGKLVSANTKNKWHRT